MADDDACCARCQISSLAFFSYKYNIYANIEHTSCHKTRRRHFDTIFRRAKKRQMDISSNAAPIPFAHASRYARSRFSSPKRHQRKHYRDAAEIFESGLPKFTHASPHHAKLIAEHHRFPSLSRHAGYAWRTARCVTYFDDGLWACFCG